MERLKIKNQNCNFDQALHVLQTINGEAQTPTLTIKEVESMGSLAQAKKELDAREAKVKTKTFSV